MPVIGNATIELEIQPPGMSQGFPVLKEKHGYVSIQLQSNFRGISICTRNRSICQWFSQTFV